MSTRRFLALLLCACAASSAAAQDLREILRRVDESRGNFKGTGVEWTVSVATTRADETRDMTLRVQSQSGDTLAEVLTPEKSRGQKFLFADGAMWFHKPGLSRPVSVSRRQRLSGDAVIGDVLGTDYAGEYEPALIGEEILDGVRSLVLELSAKTKTVTYDLIRLWVAKDTSLALKAEFYSVSRKRLRTATMEHRRRIEIAGKQRPFISQLVIVDETEGKVTTLRFSEPALKTFPPGTLTREQLTR